MELVHSNIINNMIKLIICIIFFTSLTTIVGANESKDNNDNPIDFIKLSIEELMDVEITTVSKKKEKLFEAAAAVYVITREDIRRSGATSIPEALRMAPGLQVARIDSNKWAVSSRGFNDRFSNKLLVLIDGRTIYTPVFAGVFWDRRDTLLEDVDRIEVIRGPGATLWGANAVNGVINIITRNAKETHGGLVIAGGGTDERGFGSIRYGGKLTKNVSYRVYTKYFNRDSFVNSSNHDASDGWEELRGGFRVDWEKSDQDSITFSGGFFNGNSGEKQTIGSLSPSFGKTVDIDLDNTGLHFLSEWKHIFSEKADMSLRFYYDRTDYRTEIFREIRDTFDLDFQHHFALGSAHEILWGARYHFTIDDTNDKFGVSFDPNARNDQLFSAFIQDKISFIPNILHLTLGSKFEHNDYTGIEVQPSSRLIWTPNERHTLWGAISKAVRSPAVIESDGRINFQPFRNPLNPEGIPILPTIFGDHDFESEDLVAYELGYRIHPTKKLTFDIAGFYNVYRNLRTLEPGNLFAEAFPAPLHLVIPINANNKMDGETYGVELAVDWKPFNWWRLKGTYTFLDMQLHLDKDSKDPLTELEEERIPHNQVSLRSMMDLPYDLEFDVGFRYVDNVPTAKVESYISMDVRLGWRPTRDIEISIVGQNLFDSDHQEFLSAFFDVQPTEIERGVYASVKWEF